MASNDLLLKADLAIANLQATGGYLENAQAARLVRKLIKSPTIFRDARVVEMRNPVQEINKIYFGSRIMKAANAVGTALGSSDRSSPTTEQVLLSTFEVQATVYLGYDVLEDNIERVGTLGAMADAGGTALGGGLRDTIVDLMSERAALDLEELGLTGDTSSADSYLALNDGWLLEVATNGNVSDVGGDKISKEMFKAGMQTLPVQYHRMQASMRHYISVYNDIEYRNTLADRATGAGDNFIQGLANATPFGVPTGQVQTMPEDQGLFTNPNNLIMGIQRRILMEFDKDIEARQYIINLTARVDFQVEEAEAAVQYADIGSPV